ncbi:Peptidase S8/S53 subtilisin kexin sedolisin [Ignavibacterium album JCM 16511]|uniref:Peptidase S8/S53 subtilisin kexin sedolisin n=1 Tax=Ignavibacterium album (strain DSM 19864 / JCM 16511 / NBRC 101810 / Mat9-16) TaxID=945713 RepID=I0AGN2_IGNAJ|nr:T9SS type A sorting domain-containing protein [Ignavibacterium album]AFH48139.1 Peptidase S8/S53 subtilisin kexin sedolisin [Ignavibacterium album JCM 16511]
MKSLILCILFVSISYAQVVDPTKAPFRYDSIKINYLFNELEYFINSEGLNQFANYPPITEKYKIELESKIELFPRNYPNPQFVSLQILNINKNDTDIIVNCEVVLYDSFQAYDSFFDQIRLRKDITMLFTDFGKLENLFLDKCFKIKLTALEDKPAIENQQLLLSNNSFISKPAIQNPLIYQLDLNLALNHFQKSLFASSEGIDNTYFSDGTKETAFYLDQIWKRILFTQSNSNQLKILSYGDNNDDYRFGIPRSIDVNEWGELYIADSEKGIINKLYYSYITNTITATSNVNYLQGLVKPVDADYYQGSTLWNRSDDLIAVADEGDNSIVIYNYNGQFICKLTGYYENGVKQIKSPKRVALFGYDAPYRLAFIDGGTNRLIVLRLPNNFTNWTGWLYPLSPPVSFDMPSYLTDVGVDGCYNILLADRGKNMIHKFNKDGKYSCSYANGSEFKFPYFITNVPDNCPNPEMVWVDITLSSIWDNNSGIRRYLPGADLKYISNETFSNYHRLRFNPTDDINFIADIIRVSDNTIVKSFSGNALNSLQKDLILYYNELPTNNTFYKWRFKFQPFYNSFYGQYAIPWQTLEFSFYHSVVAPVISNFTQSPNPICKGTTGYVYVNLSQGNGNLTYNWFSYNAPSGVTVNFSPNSNRCTITYSSADAVALGAEGPTWDFGCTVSNSVGESTMRYTPILSDCNGCPTLSFEQNGMLFDENPLLITSLRNPGKDVIDYYLINTPITPVNNKIKLTVHEPQTEHSWFDQISLIEATANQGENIVVNEQGQVINYSSTIPLRIMLNGQTDITSALGNMDSVTVQLNVGDVITITRFTEGVEADGDVVLGGVEPPPSQKRLSSLRMNLRKQTITEQGEEVTEIIPITEFFLRPNKSIISKRITNLPSGVIELQVNKPLELDYFAFVINLRTVKTKTLTLNSALHSLNGEIKGKLNNVDGNYGELRPTERIDLTFNTTTTTGNKAYILKTVGRYETDSLYLKGINKPMFTESSEEIPTEYKLFDNYPNPFNPTTVISWQSPVGSWQTLKVYDVLGNQVVTLVNEYREAGSYKVEFNASALASGVYIYKLTAGSYISSKKMMVIK